ncbi:MAG: NAD(P)-binding domain-containing protein, partial [Phycisphaerae bacterium]|nr:NAD(P)-binding domain-containing protein [Phycisphaerae bacterium]
AELGHEVFFGSRDTEKGRRLAEEVGRGTQGGSNDQAVRFGETILLTARELPSRFLSSVAPLAGKVLIDVNNREIPTNFRFPPMPSQSFAQLVQEDAPDALVVKAFNTIAQELWDHPPEVLEQYKVACFLAGDSDRAKAITTALVRQTGLTPIDCGGLIHAWMLEAAADLVRLLILERRMGPWTTLSVATLPRAEPRFGGRR